MRSVFTYEGQRDEDLSFPENRVIIAHPSKDGGDWWHGELAETGAKGWIPKAYLDEINGEFHLFSRSASFDEARLIPFLSFLTAQPAKALYTYTAASEDEISFEEEESLTIVDTSDESWYKAEKDGVIGLVPSTYVELS